MFFTGNCASCSLYRKNTVLGIFFRVCFFNSNSYFEAIYRSTCPDPVTTSAVPGSSSFLTNHHWLIITYHHWCRTNSANNDSLSFLKGRRDSEEAAAMSWKACAFPSTLSLLNARSDSKQSRVTFKWTRWEFSRWGYLAKGWSPSPPQLPKKLSPCSFVVPFLSFACMAELRINLRVRKIMAQVQGMEKDRITCISSNW